MKKKQNTAQKKQTADTQKMAIEQVINKQETVIEPVINKPQKNSLKNEPGNNRYLKSKRSPRPVRSVRDMVLIALFAAILCVSAYISVPLPNGSHITFFNFMVLLIGLLFPAGEAALMVLVWLLLGAVGVPVFVSGNAGIGYLLGPYGGYSFSFLLTAALMPLLRSKKYHRLSYTVLSMGGALLIDLVGALWWKFIGSLTWSQALVTGVLTFLPLDFAKAFVAAQIVPVFRKLMP